MNEQNPQPPQSGRRRTQFLAVAVLAAVIGAVALFAAVSGGADGLRTIACSHARTRTVTGTLCVTPTTTGLAVVSEGVPANSTSVASPPETARSATPTRSGTPASSTTRTVAPPATAIPSPTTRLGPTAGTASAVSPKSPSVYRIVNKEATPLNVEQVYTSASGQRYVNWTTVPPRGTTIVRMQDVQSVPNGFQGKVTLYASRPFTATLLTDPPK